MPDEIGQTPAADPTLGATEGAGETVTPDVTPEQIDTYTVKVSGEDLQVPLTELIAGYQKGADYTQKSQEVARERESLQFASAIQAALDRDPAQAIQTLSRHFGITQAAVAQMVDDGESFDDLDPAEKRFRTLDQRLSSFEERETQANIERTVSNLKARYADFDANEVVAGALRVGTDDLEGIYKQISFDKMMARQEVERKAAEAGASATAKVVAAKQAAQVVSGGSSAGGNTTTASSPPIRTVRDAFDEAERQLGS